MATFVPFAGLRFNPQKINLSTALCPPYDVIKGAARDELIARDAHNIVQVELAAPYGQDATAEQYQASADLLKRWQNEQILVRDDSGILSLRARIHRARYRCEKAATRRFGRIVADRIW